MRNVKLMTTVLASLAMLSLDAGTARALQLISNFGFDTDLSTWGGCCLGTGTVDQDPAIDFHGSGQSGSVRLSHTTGLPAPALVVSKCLTGSDVAPGTKLYYGTKLRFASGESTTGLARIAIRLQSGASCDGTSIFAISKGYQVTNVPRGTWLTLDEKPATALTVPTGTKSVMLSVEVEKTSPGTLTVNFDDVYLAPVGTPTCDGLPATQVGGPDADFINGTDESDVIVGKGAIDWIDGHGGNDRLCGGPGDDVLYGGDGDDRLFGEGGKDTLLGVAGDDLLYGAGNNDKLQGGTGKDVLRGGSGVDTCEDADPDTALRKCETVPAS